MRRLWAHSSANQAILHDMGRGRAVVFLRTGVAGDRGEGRTFPRPTRDKHRGLEKHAQSASRRQTDCLPQHLALFRAAFPARHPTTSFRGGFELVELPTSGEVSAGNSRRRTGGPTGGRSRFLQTFSPRARNCHAGENAPEISSFRERSPKPSGNFHVTFLGPEAVDAVPQWQQDASSITASMPIRAGSLTLKMTASVIRADGPGLRASGKVSFHRLQCGCAVEVSADDEGRGEPRNRCSN
jgi:hypothetical protein